jgi:hypothetical protein
MGTVVSEAIMSDATQQKAADQIVIIASDIESMDADQVIPRIPDLIGRVDQTYFELGGLLSRVADEKLWEGSGHDSFRDFIYEEFNLRYRKSMYLMAIYNDLVASEVPWAKVADIGWTRLKEISSILTKANVDEWIAKIMGPPMMTVLQVHEAVKAIKVGSLSSSGNDPIDDTSKVSTITFKVHEDQKENIETAINKAMGEADTEFKGVALDAICMNYLSGGIASKPKPLSEVFKAYQPEEVLESFALTFPNIDVTAQF